MPSFFLKPGNPALCAAGWLRVAVGAALLATAGCGHSLPELPGFDAAAWRRDPYACRNQRAQLLPALLKAKSQLYEARANDVTTLLGPPDEEELRAQTEKIYLYYLRPGGCTAGRTTRSVVPSRTALRLASPKGSCTCTPSGPSR